METGYLLLISYDLVAYCACVLWYFGLEVLMR